VTGHPPVGRLALGVDRRRRIELRPDELRRSLDPRQLGFSSTEEVAPLVGTIGQPRALDAIAFSVGTKTPGFNLFVAGPAGSGRLRAVLDYLDSTSHAGRPPDDWVYVHSFRDPDRPNAIRLPAGRGTELARALDEFLDAARREIRRAFESEEYEARQRELMTQINEERSALEADLTRFAAERGYALQTTVTGVVSIPLVDGKPITRDEFDRLPEEQRAALERGQKEIEERTAAYAHQLHQLEKRATRRLAELEREVALFATGPLFRDLEERFADQPEVLSHLGDVKKEVLASIGDFRESEQGALPLALGVARDPTSRFRVNAFVDHGSETRAPVVVETNPTYYNLLGRVEYRYAFGSMVTDFREIQPGSLHRANGGFLVLDALEILRHPFSWDALKRALRGGEVQIENLGVEYSAIPSATLRPEPIPLDVKVILLGSPALYHLLFRLDEDFRELFKVKADFGPELDWSREHERNYARFVSRWVRDNGLRHFDAGAVARLVEHGARLRESQRKLSARLVEISDVISEASYWAEREDHRLVAREDVDRAIRKREYRSNLIEERLQELIRDGTLVIETDGARVGQVNGLSVIDLGDHEFGRPSRVSAQVALGRGDVASNEREIELSGPIHSKGVLILTGYLAAAYAQTLPLAVSATLTFEQSYDEVDGDSASSTELYALLSALSGLPLDQGIAVTGSVDQHGNVQAVGGVTRKIEGFFAVCKQKGLTGRQGVIIPAANVRNLMLDEEVVEAVRLGRFHVWAVRTVDEGIALLTGTPAGRSAADGSYPAGTVHALVSARLEAYADQLQAFGTPADGRTPSLVGS
jgi:lon-related putative ATP-dependent protease